MRKYIPGGRFDSSVTFSFDSSQFGNLELILNVERGIKLKVDLNWKVGIGGSIFATPVVKDGVVYVGACDKNFYAVDAETGRVLWRFPTSNAILSTAFLDGNMLYFGSFDGCLYAISTSGRLVWKFASGDKIFSDPLVWKDRIYFGSRNGNVYALEKSSGKIAWVFSTGGPISSSPVVHEGTLYIGSNDRNLYAIDAETGRMKWKFPTGGEVRYTPAVWDDKIIFGSLDGLIRAVDTKGTLVWDFATNEGIGTAHQIISNGLVFFGSRDMCYYALDNKGKLVWKYRAKGPPCDAIVLNGLLYLGHWENNLCVLDEKTGRELWTFPTNGFVVQISHWEGKIFFGTWDCALYCITPDGKLLWKFHTSLSTKSPVEIEEEREAQSFEVTWLPELAEGEGPKESEKELSDYGEIKSDYASGIGSDYLGKKKRGYA
ncbi:MAG: PQQ-binding-like beta-propeller repeat protein [Candidatus Aenigmarchaeota archaeon]|nr:PQQ-binding-like beta-propeller repeat protein [Candidatus Aenigmarchaeota archaeon]